MTSAVVVGGGSGIGAAVVTAQRAQGVEVLAWDVGVEADIRCDITDPQQVAAATAATIERIGVPAVVTVTAGSGTPPCSSTHRPMTGTGWWNERQGGVARDAIVGAADVGERRWLHHRHEQRQRPFGRQVNGLYCVSKAALDMLIKVAAVEWAPTVRVNGVAPGVTHTAMLVRCLVTEDGCAVCRNDVFREARDPRLHRPSHPGPARHGLVTGQVLTCDGTLAPESDRPTRPARPLMVAASR